LSQKGNDRWRIDRAALVMCDAVTVCILERMKETKSQGTRPHHQERRGWGECRGRTVPVCPVGGADAGCLQEGEHIHCT